MGISSRKARAVVSLSPLDLVLLFHSLICCSINSPCASQVEIRMRWMTLILYGSPSSNARMHSMYGSALQTQCCSTLSSHGTPLLSPRGQFVDFACPVLIDIHVMRSLAQSPTLHYASRKAFKNSNLNSNLHQREKQSRAQSPLAPRIFSKPLKASRADSYSGLRRLSRLAVPALAQAR